MEWKIENFCKTKSLFGRIGKFSSFSGVLGFACESTSKSLKFLVDYLKQVMRRKFKIFNNGFFQLIKNLVLCKN
jgi:hypothetical protein